MPGQYAKNYGGGDKGSSKGRAQACLGDNNRTTRDTRVKNMGKGGGRKGPAINADYPIGGK